MKASTFIRMLWASKAMRLARVMGRVTVFLAILYLAAQTLYTALSPSGSASPWEKSEQEAARAEARKWHEEKKLLFQETRDKRKAQEDGLFSMTPPVTSPDYPHSLIGKRLLFNPTHSLTQWVNLHGELNPDAGDDELTAELMKALGASRHALCLTGEPYPLMDFTSENEWSCFDKGGTATYHHEAHTALSLLRVKDADGKRHLYLLWFLDAQRGLCASYHEGERSITIWIPFLLTARQAS